MNDPSHIFFKLDGKLMHEINSSIKVNSSIFETSHDIISDDELEPVIKHVDRFCSSLFPMIGTVRGFWELFEQESLEIIKNML